mmetsp:Transcript_96432/g.167515  ORF Transcript_96432/g.167515 Transcript_96432/m.167515 type:complete len:96 (-) Transcript_96432:59-346(-)
MCDELGPSEEYMQQYVEEQGGTSLCSIEKTDKGCSEQQIKFIEKWASKPGDEKLKQLERLSSMAKDGGKAMKPEAFTWLKHRIAIFKQFKKKEEL